MKRLLALAVALSIFGFVTASFAADTIAPCCDSVTTQHSQFQDLSWQR